MQDGVHWAVIVANGYDSDNGHAVLFVLDASTGAVLQKIDTGVGSPTSPNGLSSPLAVDTNNDFKVDTVYAGDLQGNLWKFDLSGTAGSWPAPSVFFVACTTSGTSCSMANRQPITGKPNVGAAGATGTAQNNVGRMIYFGTGKYFETGDNTAGTNPQVETFYGLWDKGTAITDRSLLQAQTITFDGIATTVGGTQTPTAVRVVSQNSVCYAATSTGCNSSSTLNNGWTLDLLLSGSTAQGERVVSFPLVRRGVVIFSTLIPSTDPCSSGGTSRLMEIDALAGGAFINGAAFDTNNDGKVDSKDSIKITVMINGISTVVTTVASGLDLGIGITKTPAVIEGDSGSSGGPNVDFKKLSGSSGDMGEVRNCNNPAGCNGTIITNGARKSWQQLK
jgi:type IV pilus assembly protein PilY1